MSATVLLLAAALASSPSASAEEGQSAFLPPPKPEWVGLTMPSESAASWESAFHRSQALGWAGMALPAIGVGAATTFTALAYAGGAHGDGPIMAGYGIGALGLVATPIVANVGAYRATRMLRARRIVVRRRPLRYGVGGVLGGLALLVVGMCRTMR